MPIVPSRSLRVSASATPVHRPDIVARPRVRQRSLAANTGPLPAAPSEPADAPELHTAAPASPPPPRTKGNAAGYEVGYGRPPKHTRFRKGQSGNPKGRPKGAKAFNTIVRETLTTKLRVRTAKGRKNVTHVQALMMQTIESALKGSRQDRHELLRYYRDAVPDEPQVLAGDSLPTNAEAEDTDAHDRAILERLRASIIAEAGDEQ
jgi:hypothetical protein